MCTQFCFVVYDLAGYLTLLRLPIGLTTTHNSVSWGFSALFWPLWALDMHVITYIRAGNMHIHKTQYKHLKEAKKIICAFSMLQYQLSKSVNQPCRMFNIGVAFVGNYFTESSTLSQAGLDFTMLLLLPSRR